MRDKGEFLFTSESVSEGHPDKVADRISDTVLDAYLAADPYARVACETLVTTNRSPFCGEPRVTARERVDTGGTRQPIKAWDVRMGQRGRAQAHVHVEEPSTDVMA